MCPSTDNLRGNRNPLSILQFGELNLTIWKDTDHLIALWENQHLPLLGQLRCKKSDLA